MKITFYQKRCFLQLKNIFSKEAFREATGEIRFLTGIEQRLTCSGGLVSRIQSREFSGLCDCVILSGFRPLEIKNTGNLRTMVEGGRIGGKVDKISSVLMCV